MHWSPQMLENRRSRQCVWYFARGSPHLVFERSQSVDAGGRVLAIDQLDALLQTHLVSRCIYDTPVSEHSVVVRLEDIVMVRIGLLQTRVVV